MKLASAVVVMAVGNTQRCCEILGGSHIHRIPLSTNNPQAAIKAKPLRLNRTPKSPWLIPKEASNIHPADQVDGALLRDSRGSEFHGDFPFVSGSAIDPYEML